MNCSHQGDGWCLKCVEELRNDRDAFVESYADVCIKLTDLENKTNDYEYLLFFRHAAGDYMGPGESACINSINNRYQKKTGKELPKGWRDE